MVRPFRYMYPISAWWRNCEFCLTFACSETLNVCRPKLSSLFQLIPIAERIKPIYIINMIKLVKLFVTQFQLEIGMIRPFTNN